MRCFRRCSCFDKLSTNGRSSRVEPAQPPRREKEYLPPAPAGSGDGGDQRVFHLADIEGVGVREVRDELAAGRELQAEHPFVLVLVENDLPRRLPADGAATSARVPVRLGVEFAAAYRSVGL